MNIIDKFQLKTPVAFLIFNRPDTTKQVFKEIRRARPPQLLVVADGPRSNNLEDSDKCEEARAIIDGVDWTCEVITNYSDVNLGCKQRVSSGLDWVFNNVNEAIILEDDCLPDPSFFRYCEELLEKYRTNEKVMMISGDNFQFGHNLSQYSYYFSRYTHIWGWASWSCAWKHYDVNMKMWPTVRDGKMLHDGLGNKRDASYWKRLFDTVYKGEINTWDYQWTFACWVQNGLTILPSVNLISNIGFSNDATHTLSNSPFSNMETVQTELPLRHPPFVSHNVKADDFTQRTHYNPNLLFRVGSKLRSLRLLSK